MTKRGLFLGTMMVALAACLAAQQRTQGFGVTTVEVRYRTLQDAITSVASAAADEATLRAVTARFSGWVETVSADRQYQRVRQGETLCTIYSPEIYAAEQDYLFAIGNEATLQKSAVPGVAAGAAALGADARARLEQMQVPEEEIARLERTRKAQKRFPIVAPEGGIVSERLALPGMRVEAGTRLYTLSRLQPIWVLAEVQESELGPVRVGQAAQVSLDAYPGRRFAARVDFIVPQVEAGSRTGQVRLVLANRDLAIAPGMYGSATVEVSLGRQLVVPADAVVQAGTQALAFVAGPDGQYTPRTVQVGAQVGDELIIRTGLRAGERVAAGASFLIASEAQLSAAAGSFAPPPPGVNAGMAAATQAARITLTTAPSPARQGENTFRVLLTTAGGTPIAGAQVGIHLSMPAMPAMGMAAMDVTVKLAVEGGGRYSGRGTLGSAGNWQVVITATKNGQLVAQTHTSLRAAGGL